MNEVGNETEKIEDAYSSSKGIATIRQKGPKVHREEVQLPEFCTADIGVTSGNVSSAGSHGRASAQALLDGQSSLARLVLRGIETSVPDRPRSKIRQPKARSKAQVWT